MKRSWAGVWRGGPDVVNLCLSFIKFHGLVIISANCHSWR
jgi:hypothetical protein